MARARSREAIRFQETRDAARQRELAHRDAVRAEHRINSSNATLYRFADHNDLLAVTDFRASMEDAGIQVGGIPDGDGPLLFLLPGGGGIIKGPRYVADANPAVRDIPAFGAWVATVSPLIAEAATRYPGLGHLRSEAWMRSFAEASGLAIASSTTESWQGNLTAGVRTVTTVDLPVLAGARVARDGLRLRFRHRPGDRLDRWTKALPILASELTAAGFTVGDATVSQHPSGDFILALRDRDPAASMDLPTGVRPYDAERGQSLLGVRVSDGAEAWLTWAGVPGCIIGGIPKSGKTSSMLPILAGMAGLAELHLFDGKSAFDLKPLEGVAATFDRTGDLTSIVPTLDRLVELIKIRSEAIHQVTGWHDFWAIPPAERQRLNLFPIVLVVDECQHWLNASGKSAADKKVVEKVTGQIRELIQKGRFVGLSVMLSTQKPDATNIPTIIRDLCENRVAFRTKTQAQSACILGVTPDDAPEPHRIPAKAQGRCVAVTAEGDEELVQAIYVPMSELREYLADKSPVPNQYQIALDLLQGR
jgi:S-DNA-T family DNA segregation ATPase FtsK/SpoIIIE